jgi:hypothetical protein
MRIRGIKGLAGAMAVLFMLAACGGDAQLGTGPGNGGPGNGDPDPDPDPDPGFTQFQVGRIVNGTFEQGVIDIGLPQLAAGGTTGLRVDVVNASGAIITDQVVSANFVSSCISNGNSSVNPNPTDSVAGVITASYTAEGCSGNDTITVTVQGGGLTRTAQGSVQIQQANIGGAEFVSATPAVIGLSGASIPQNSTVVFRVRNNLGQPVAGQPVNFSIDNPSTGATLSSTSGATNGEGLVQTVLTAGSQPGPLRVVLSTANPLNGMVFSTQSDVLNVSTGLPTSRTISLSASRLNIPGLGCDGEPTTLNVRMADRYGNPVPAQTTAAFVTNGGAQVANSCNTGDPLGDPLTEAGVCSVLLTAQGTRPVNGRVFVRVSAQGEVGFNDLNGNGYYDAGEPFDTVAEPFFDTTFNGADAATNENGVWNPGEPFTDRNGNGVHDADATGGQFVGYRCDAPGQNCAFQTLTVWQPGIIVLSGTSPLIQGIDYVEQPMQCNPAADVCVVTSPLDLVGNTVRLTTPNQNVLVLIRIKDINDNPMPADTDVSLLSDIGEVRTGTQQVPNNIERGGNLFSFSIRGPDGDDPESGFVEVNTTVPAFTCSGAVSVTNGLFGLSYEP